MSGKLGNQDPQQVLDAALRLELELRTLPEITLPEDGDWMRVHQRHRAAYEQLAADMRTRKINRATISEGSNGWRISMLGIRASSTGGFKAACTNWIAQARAKAANTVGVRSK